MKSVKKEVSFRRKLMTAVLSVTLPLIALLLFSNLYSTQAFNRKIADSNMRTMDYRAGRMEEQLDSVNDFLTGLTVSDDYRTLSGGEKTPLKAYLASYTLITQLKTALPAYGDVGAFFHSIADSFLKYNLFRMSYFVTCLPLMCVLYVTCRNIFSLNLFRKSSIFSLFFQQYQRYFRLR